MKLTKKNILIIGGVLVALLLVSGNLSPLMIVMPQTVSACTGQPYNVRIQIYQSELIQSGKCGTSGTTASTVYVGSKTTAYDPNGASVKETLDIAIPYHCYELLGYDFPQFSFTPTVAGRYRIVNILNFGGVLINNTQYVDANNCQQPICTANADICSNGWVYKCSSDGFSKTPVKYCSDGMCNNGVCNACVNGNKKCLDSSTITSCVDGSWANTLNCPYGCSNGACGVYSAPTPTPTINPTPTPNYPTPTPTYPSATPAVIPTPTPTNCLSSVDSCCSDINCVPTCEAEVGGVASTMSAKSNGHCSVIGGICQYDTIEVCASGTCDQMLGQCTNATPIPSVSINPETGTCPIGTKFNAEKTGCVTDWVILAGIAGLIGGGYLMFASRKVKGKKKRR